MKMEIKIPTHGWQQVGGDMNPGAHGGIIATADGSSIEIREIQPTRAYVGDGEAAEVGYPFWSKDGYFDLDDLNPDSDSDDVRSAMESWGMSADDLEQLTAEQRALAIAQMLLSYGRGDEGPSGWADDVVPDDVLWWGSKQREGASYLSDEDDEFRELLNPEDDDEDEDED